MNRFTGIVRVLACAALAAGSFSPAGAAPSETESAGRPAHSEAKETILRAVARRARVPEGGTIVVEVRVSGARNAGAIAFHLVYDPSHLRPVEDGAREAGFLRQGGAPTSFLSRPASTGDRIIAGVARLGGRRGAGGDGTVCRFVFRALQPGSTALALDRVHVRSPEGAESPARALPATLVILPARTAPAPAEGAP